MAKPLLCDEKWKQIQHLFPPPPSRPRGGRRCVDYRCVLTGILFVLKTGIQWEQLPQELGYGSGMTCWRRLRAWQAAGVWHRLHLALLAELRGAGQLDFSRACVDGASVASPRGASSRGRTRRTGASSAANATLSPTAQGCR